MLLSPDASGVSIILQYEDTSKSRSIGFRSLQLLLDQLWEFAFGKPSDEAFCRHRSCKQVPLSNVTSSERQLVENRFVFNALAHDAKAEVMREVNYGTNDGGVSVILIHICDEHPSDLEFRNRQR